MTSLTMERLYELNMKTLSDSQKQELIMEFTYQEIKESFFDIDSNKSPGPDGLNSYFFKECWGIIGGHVCATVRHIFRTRRIAGRLNVTHIYLIPKIHSPSTIRDFRPIASCNVLYKAILNTIASRLKNIIASIVSPNQAAFLPGKNIHENLLLAHELVRGYGRRKGSKRVAIKVDIKGAYDTVNWECLFMLLNRCGFLVVAIEWIRMCMCSPKYSELVNGEVYGYFDGMKGLRQGDPLSPILLKMVMGLLTAMLQEGLQKKKFQVLSNVTD